jgi:hypothetical protein
MPTPSVVEFGETFLHPAFAFRFFTSPMMRRSLRIGSTAIASRHRGYFFFFAFLFAVLRAVFFAADLVLAFALFAMLPS